MALTLKIDSFDFSTMIRLQPGEGFDPSQNTVEPIFGDASPGEGNPLLGLSEPNRLMTWPLHLTPAKTSDADTKDGLHSLVQQVNVTCRDAKRVEWKDDSATNSTFFDVVAAKFEPDHSHWKARKLYLSGILKVWVKPYGDTGTLRIAGTAQTTAGVAVAVPLGSVVGDVSAQVRSVIQVGSLPIQAGRIVGMSIVPSSYTWDIPAASLSMIGGGTLMGASGAPGSQIARQDFASLSFGKVKDADGFEDFAQFSLSPASVYAGRNRMLGVAQLGLPFTEIRAVDWQGREIGRGVASALPGRGYSTVDFGAFSVPSASELGTIAVKLQIRARQGYNFAPLHGGPVNVARVLVLPDDRTCLIADSPRRALAGDDLRALETFPTSLVGKADNYGNAYTHATRIAEYSLAMSGATSYGRAYLDFGAFGESPALAHIVDWVDATAADMTVEMIGNLQNWPSAGLMVGKHTAIVGSTAGHVVAARLHNANNASVFGLSLLGFTGHLGSAPQVFASVAVPRASSQDLTVNSAIVALRFTSVGKTVSAQVVMGTSLASYAMVTATGVASGAAINGGAPGNPLVGLVAPAGDAVPKIYGWQAAAIASEARAPGDRYVFDGQTNQVYVRTGASVYAARTDDRVRGALPQAAPSRAAHAIAFNLPYDGDPGNDLVAMDVRIRERFRYAG